MQAKHCTQSIADPTVSAAPHLICACMPLSHQAPKPSRGILTKESVHRRAMRTHARILTWPTPTRVFMWPRTQPPATRPQQTVKMHASVCLHLRCSASSSSSLHGSWPRNWLAHTARDPHTWYVALLPSVEAAPTVSAPCVPLLGPVGRLTPSKGISRRLQSLGLRTQGTPCTKHQRRCQSTRSCTSCKSRVPSNPS